MKVIDFNEYEVPLGITENDIDYLYDFILKNAPELINQYTAMELAKLYCVFSEEVWCASWEDNAEGQFIEWMKE